MSAIQAIRWSRRCPSGCLSSACVLALGGGFASPYGVAVDVSGNVYVADSPNSAVDQIPPGCVSSTCVTSLGGGFQSPAGVAVDGSGNIYVADTYHHAVKEMPSGCASSACVTTLGGGYSYPYGVAVDPASKQPNVYVADTGVTKIMPHGVNLGTVAVGSATSPATLYFTFSTSGSGITASVLTQGATGLDFADAGTGTCDTNGNTHTYNSGDSCTVNVTFAPKYAGQRYGAVNLSSAGGVLATAYIYGTGQGPQLVFPSHQTFTPLGSGAFLLPDGLAVDGSGTVYVASYDTNAVVKIPPGCASSACVTTVGGGFSGPQGVAVDGSGNIYVADYFNNKVKELSPTCNSSSCVTTLGGGFTAVTAVAVDGAGNIYIAESPDNLVKEMPPGCASASCVVTLGGGFDYPNGVAVDGNGNIYIADTDNNAVKEMPPGCSSSSCVTKLGGGFTSPYDVTVDPSGMIYVADSANNSVKTMPPGCASSACVTTLAGGFNHPYGVTLDGSGNLYVSDGYNNAVRELPLATPPTLAFADAPLGYQSSDSPKIALLRNIGNVTLTFPVPGSGENPSVSSNFTLDPSTTCPEVLSSFSSPGTLAAGASCSLAVDFIPTAIGTITGTAVLTDDNLNASPATQTVTLIGADYSIWIVDGTGGTSELNGDGSPVTSSTDPGLNIALAVDHLGDVWTIGSGSPPVEETSPSGSYLGVIAANSGGLNAPTAIAIDGASRIWIANGNNTLSLFASPGTPLSPSAGFTDPSLSSPAGIAIDLAGSVWITNKTGNSVTRVLGAAAPVAPIATSVANNTTGGKP